MLETSARLLKLLSLLQMPRDWTGAELADRLGVAPRTVRRDVDRLRELGYPVHAVRGAAGYRLGAGASLPPLLLDDEEAVAVTVGLRSAAGGTVAGIEDASLRALAKLEQVLPPRLRYWVQTLQAATVRVSGAGPTVSPDSLMMIADACRRHEQLRFGYIDHHERESSRLVEPHSLVSFGRHWYLVGWDTGREDWRMFRVDRLQPGGTVGSRFTPRELPHGDVATYLSYQLSSQAWASQATVALHQPAEAITARIWPGMGVVEAVDDRSCLMHVGADTPDALAWMITALNVDFSLVSFPPELEEVLRSQAARCLASLPAE